MKSKRGKKQAHFEKIEQYLDGKLKSEEKQAFEQNLKSDDALRKEVDLHKDLASYLGGSPEDALRANLNQIGSRHRKKGKMIRGGIIFFLLLTLSGLGFLYLNKQDSHHTTSDTIPLEYPTKEVTKQLKETVPIIEQPPSPILKKKEIKTVSPKETNSLPIAANFTPNPLLESHIGNSIRGGTYDFEITENQLIKEKNNSILHINGHIETEESYRPVFSSFLSYLSVDSGFNFEINASLDLDKGLYYYLLEDADSGEIYVAGRVELE